MPREASLAAPTSGLSLGRPLFLIVTSMLFAGCLQGAPANSTNPSLGMEYANDIEAAYEQGLNDAMANLTAERDAAYAAGYDQATKDAQGTYQRGYDDGYNKGFNEGHSKGVSSQDSSEGSGEGGGFMVTDTIQVEADTYVKSSYPENNYGARSTLSVFRFASERSYALLRFNLEHMNAPNDNQAVCLAIESQNHSPDFPFHIAVYTYESNDWNEYTINWTSFSESSMGQSFGSHEVQHNEIETWDVSPAIRNASSSGTVSYVLSMVQESSLGSSWWSREGNTSPTLSVMNSC